MKKTYITTSIAYVNAEPHIGFLFELLAGDIIKRRFKQAGHDAFLLTGTDEHGIKVAQAAATTYLEPKAYADKLAAKFKDLGEQFSINFDYFVRTTDEHHIKFVQEKWRQLAKGGLLQKKTYSGLYCNGCEAFKTEGEVANNKCVIHDKELEKVQEDNWFLISLKAHRQQIRQWIDKSVFPANRRQEVINTLESGAYDEVSVSRPKTKNSWGVEVPGDPDQIMYVWVDALFNYLSALEITKQQELWPADIQIIGKDILKFHAIIWPSLLLATGYELPRKLLVHGFINVDGKKMSKSLGNVIAPQQLLDRYGVDGTRYLLFRGLSFDDDSNFTWADFDRLYNGELANGFGNLVTRLIGIIKNLESFSLPEITSLSAGGTELDFRQSLESANKLINQADGLITAEKLWENPSSKTPQIIRATSYLLEAASHLEPFMPDTVAEVNNQLSKRESKTLFPRL